MKTSTVKIPVPAIVYVEGVISEFKHWQSSPKKYNVLFNISNKYLDKMPVSMWNMQSRWIMQDGYDEGSRIFFQGKLKAHSARNYDYTRNPYIELLQPGVFGDIDVSRIQVQGNVDRLRYENGMIKFDILYSEKFNKDTQHDSRVSVVSKERINIMDGEEVTVTGQLRKGKEVYIELEEISGCKERESLD